MPSPVALRASLRPSVIVLALVAVSAAGCSSDTSRFEGPFSNPFASSSGATTASVNSAQSGRIESTPLAAPVQTGALPPPTHPAPTSVAYQPAGGQQDITGSVASGGWDWNGGTAITVSQSDTLETLSQRHGVPASVIMQANAITVPPGLHPGQR